MSNHSEYWQEKARHEKIKADIATLELAEKQKNLVSVHEVKSQLDRVNAIIRKRLLEIPDNVTPFIMEEETLEGKQICLEQEVYMALSELSFVLSGESGDTENE